LLAGQARSKARHAKELFYYIKIYIMQIYILAIGYWGLGVGGEGEGAYYTTST
jgi:hypothetical protein